MSYLDCYGKKEINTEYEPKLMSITVIIPAWNEAKVLKRTMEALIGANIDKTHCEVIVVAGGNDGTLAIARDLHAVMGQFSSYIVIEQQPGGKNHAIQDGLVAAKNEIVVLLDADTIVTRDGLGYMIDRLIAGKSDLVIANPIPDKDSWISEYYKITKEYVFNDISTYPGNAMAFRMNTIDGRFDTFFNKTIKVGVDYYLQKRFLQEGYNVEMVPEAKVITCVPTSLKYCISTEYRWLTAYIQLEGFRCRSFAANVAIVGGLIFLIPFSRWFFISAVMINSIFVYKRSSMFMTVQKKGATKMKYLPGFIFLSYIQHFIGFVAWIEYLFGMKKKLTLYQGERPM